MTRITKGAQARAQRTVDKDASSDVSTECDAVGRENPIAFTALDDDTVEVALDGSAACPVPASAASQRVSKLDRLVALLRRADGASLSELQDATGWQAHSVRGAIAGSLKRKGHAVVSDRADGTRRYRIASEP